MEGNEILKLIIEKIKLRGFFQNIESESKKEDPRVIADIISFELRKYTKEGILIFGYKNISGVDFSSRPSVRWLAKKSLYKQRKIKFLGHVPMPEAWEFVGSVEACACEDMYQNMAWGESYYLGEVWQVFYTVDLSKETQHEEDLESLIKDYPYKPEEIDMIVEASGVCEETARKLVEIASAVRIEFKKRKIKGDGLFSRTLSTERLIIAALRLCHGGVETLKETIIDLFSILSAWNDGSTREVDSERHYIKELVMGKFGDL